MARGGFSIASVLLGYLMVAGGICLALLALSWIRPLPAETKVQVAAAFGAGAFVGGFFAARASRGSTIVEPALGAVLVIGTLLALFGATPVGRMLWSYAARVALVLGAVALVGALLGAAISEKALGAATTSAIPWVLYVALAVAGGCFLAFLIAVAVGFSTAASSTVAGAFARDRATQITVLCGIAGGCLIAGLATGASSRKRVLWASFLGAAAGVFGFFVLAASLQQQHLDRDGLIGAAAIALGGGVIALISTAVGWAVIGRRQGG